MLGACALCGSQLKLRALDDAAVWRGALLRHAQEYRHRFPVNICTFFSLQRNKN